jgi:aspartate kinase
MWGVFYFICMGDGMNMDRKPQNTLVMKFGGTSVGSAQAITQAVDIIHNAKTDWDRVVVVTSAMAGVTNTLIDCAMNAAKGNLQPLLIAERTLKKNHEDVAQELITDPERLNTVKKGIADLSAIFGDLCRAIHVIGEASPRALDAVASLGERWNAHILAAICQEKGISAQFIESTSLIVTNNNFQNAHPDFEASAKAIHTVLNPFLNEGIVPIVTGFIGATRDGVITTLGRGGSDYSASILGALLPADDIWIWTDVDGVMTADPHLVPDAHTIPEISYEEIAELAYYGAKVLHPKAVRPVIEAGIGLRICNTFNPSNPGTRLTINHNGRAAKVDKVIKAVTAIRKQRLVTVEGRGMLGVPGVAARTFGAVASTGTSVPLITQASSEQSICFAVPGETSEAVLQAIKKTFALELVNRDIDRVWATDDVSIITVVGAGTHDTPGVAGLIFHKLGEYKINVLAIAHGSSDVSISLVVASKDDELAVRALHELIVW